jgi:hypothetical protein
MCEMADWFASDVQWKIVYAGCAVKIGLEMLGFWEF